MSDERDRESVSRRDWLAFVPVALLAWLGRKRAAARSLKPPGALPSPRFEEACIKCYRCAEVCPVKAIRLESSLDPRHDETPFIVARERACIACMECTQVCPTDALRPIDDNPAVVAREVRMGVPVLNKGKCLAWTGKGICRLCYYVCPYPERAVRLDGVRQGPVFDASACIGCGLCEEACPEAAQAIHIEPIA